MKYLNLDYKLLQVFFFIINSIELTALNCLIEAGWELSCYWCFLDAVARSASMSTNC